ncbi:MAG TPA: hypothetical protein DCF66_02875 [Lachnospiraceae bacterium]|nr:hypothetical protein [Lachnospiraceae bacterium]
MAVMMEQVTIGKTNKIRMFVSNEGIGSGSANLVLTDAEGTELLNEEFHDIGSGDVRFIDFDLVEYYADHTNKDFYATVTCDEELTEYNNRDDIHIVWAISYVPNLVLPTSVTMIEDGAFEGVVNLVVLLPADVTFISDTAFDPSTVLIVPEGSKAEKAVKGLDLETITE